MLGGVRRLPGRIETARPGSLRAVRCVVSVVAAVTPDVRPSALERRCAFASGRAAKGLRPCRRHRRAL